MSELTNARHEAFAQGIAEGMKKKDAYTAAFPNSQRWKDQTIYNRASELAKREEVAERVQELQQQATNETILSITRRKEILSQMAEDKQESSQARIKAIDTLNRMEGVYTENVNVNGTINNPFAGLSTDELRRLANDG